MKFTTLKLPHGKSSDTPRFSSTFLTLFKADLCTFQVLLADDAPSRASALPRRLECTPRDTKPRLPGPREWSYLFFARTTGVTVTPIHNSFQRGHTDSDSQSLTQATLLAPSKLGLTHSVAIPVGESVDRPLHRGFVAPWRLLGPLCHLPLGLSKVPGG